jgi:molybdenum-dependent DNA-binding transcriptional regulator ModE
MPLPEHEELPDNIKAMSRTQLVPYKLSAIQLDAVERVFKQIYTFARLGGYNRGFMEANEILTKLLEEQSETGKIQV